MNETPTDLEDRAYEADEEYWDYLEADRQWVAQQWVAQHEAGEDWDYLEELEELEVDRLSLEADRGAQ